MNLKMLIFLDTLRTCLKTSSINLNFLIICLPYLTYISGSLSLYIQPCVQADITKPIDEKLNTRRNFKKEYIKKYRDNPYEDPVESPIQTIEQPSLEVERGDSKSDIDITYVATNKTSKKRKTSIKRVESPVKIKNTVDNNTPESNEKGNKRQKYKEDLSAIIASKSCSGKKVLTEDNNFSEYRTSEIWKVADFINMELEGILFGNDRSLSVLISSKGKETYFNFLNRIISNINTCFLSKGENVTAIKNKNDSTKDTFLSLLDSIPNPLEIEEFNVKQYENEEFTKLFDNLLDHFLSSLKKNLHFRFYFKIKEAASILCNSANLNPNEIIKALLYEMRILKYEVRDMRSVMFIIIYNNLLENKQSRIFMDCFICRLYVFFKFLNSFNIENIDNTILENISYFIYKAYYSLFYGDENRNACVFVKKINQNSKDIYEMINDSKIFLPFRLPDLLLFRLFGFKKWPKIHSMFLNILKLIKSDYRVVFMKTECYVFLQKISIIGNLLVPEKTNFIV
ncbi:hypothetical protein NGRA_1398 [Nosema granulosis]|uniref:Uncharacterized protein n=1 Tax=Nosema granulosis TaxID=83296 RepID=A0A9P6GYK4_9MICR|nr:hypothetical protein NGRA_1398 [Nosema granulosis]